MITGGDEGVQLNEGTRLGFVGSGFRLDGFETLVPTLKQLFPKKELVMAASAENDWVRQQMELSTWEQTDALAQQQIEALADKVKLPYAGFLPFADPEEIEHGVKGHMVRPKGIHIANKICFTVAGGEQKFHLGYFMISADWVSEVDATLVKKIIEPQIAFYEELVSRELPRLIDAEELSDEEELPEPLFDDVRQQANIAVLKKLSLV